MLFLTAFTMRAVDVPRSNINPALLYWQAFSTLEALSASETTALAEFIHRTGPFDSSTAHALLDKQERALSRFRKATESVADCDWGMAYEEGANLPLPHIAKLQTLSRLALLKAEILFANHQTNEAMDWLLTVHRAARHCGSGDLIIPVLSQFQIEQSVIRVTAAQVLDWDAPSRLEYLSKWKNLPPLHTVKNAIKGELHYIDWMENFWLQGVGLNITPAIANDGIVTDSDEATMTAEERAEAEKLVAQFSAENIRKWIQEMRVICLKMQSTLDKPWLESNPTLLALQSEYKKSDNLIMRLATPMPLHKVNDLAFKTATFNAMLQAALEHGLLLDEKKISAYKDAYLDTPLMLAYSADKTLLITVSPETLKKIGTKIELTLPLVKQK
ncbi:hypothetical protein BH11VER1_BH11VER1_23610 [soil metagenome]